MFKFTLGQKVRHIDKQIFGEVAGMECYNEDKVYAIRTDQGLEHFIEDALEEFRFKKGDVVRVIASNEELDDFFISLSEPRIVKVDRTYDDCIMTDREWGYKVSMVELIPQHQLDQSIKDAEVKLATDTPTIDLSKVGQGDSVCIKLENLPKSDPVNHPSHYTQGGIETIDFIRAKMTHEQFEGYLLGNVIKYLTRYNHKGNAVQDLEKAQTYLKWLTEHIKGE